MHFFNKIATTKQTPHFIIKKSGLVILVFIPSFAVEAVFAMNKKIFFCSYLIARNANQGLKSTNNVLINWLSSHWMIKNNTPEFTDEEIMAIYLFRIEQQMRKAKQIH
jgi:hypothetical protein